MPLLGERVRLREFRRDDVPRIQEWVNDHEVNQYMSWWVAPQSWEDTERFVESRINPGPGGELGFVICLRDDPGETYIGSCGLRVDDRNRFATLGIVIGRKDLWSRGLGRDAIRTLLGHGFGTLGLNKINLTCVEFNERGARCYRACGFREEGRVRQRWLREGRFWDEIHMGLTREEYLAAGDGAVSSGPAAPPAAG